VAGHTDDEGRSIETITNFSNEIVRFLKPIQGKNVIKDNITDFVDVTDRHAKKFTRNKSFRINDNNLHAFKSFGRRILRCNRYFQTRRKAL